jgi:glycosyltransferase involved in cell wall biosynthesis
MQYIHHSLGTWREKVDVFIALTEFAMTKFINAGLPEKKIFIKPNFLLSPPRPKFSPGGYALFVGRLSPEKGIFTLLNAWKRLGNVPLKVVGEGPLKKEAEQFVEKHNLFNVDIVGMVSRDTVVEFMRNAMVVVFPSEWYEGFPMTLVEAYACGKPVIASRIGAMREIVRDGGTGLLFELKNPGDLAEKVNSIAGNSDECERMGKKAREEFEKLYTADKNFETLMDIYRGVKR